MTAEAPRLRTEHFELRGFEAGDLEAYTAMHADPDVMRMIAEGLPMTPSQAWAQLAFHIGQWELRGYGTWAVVDATDGRLAGRIGLLHPPDLADPELGLLLDKPWQRQGYGRELGIAVFDWAWNVAGLTRITCWIRPSNVATWTIAESLDGLRVGSAERHGATFDLWAFGPDPAALAAEVAAHPLLPTAPAPTPEGGWRSRLKGRRS